MDLQLRHLYMEEGRSDILYYVSYTDYKEGREIDIEIFRQRTDYLWEDDYFPDGNMIYDPESFEKYIKELKKPLVDLGLLEDTNYSFKEVDHYGLNSSAVLWLDRRDLLKEDLKKLNINKKAFEDLCRKYKEIVRYI